MSTVTTTQKNAVKGDMIAQCELGMFYETQGKYDEAMFWLMKSAEQGYDLAQYQVAVNYEKGLGVDKDYSKAARYFLLSAQQGFKSSMFEIATLYEIGKGVERSSEKSKYWLGKYYEIE